MNIQTLLETIETEIRQAYDRQSALYHTYASRKMKAGEYLALKFNDGYLRAMLDARKDLETAQDLIKFKTVLIASIDEVDAMDYDDITSYTEGYRLAQSRLLDEVKG